MHLHYTCMQFFRCRPFCVFACFFTHSSFTSLFAWLTSDLPVVLSLGLSLVYFLFSSTLQKDVETSERFSSSRTAEFFSFTRLGYSFIKLFITGVCQTLQIVMFLEDRDKAHQTLQVVGFLVARDKAHLFRQTALVVLLASLSQQTMFISKKRVGTLFPQTRTTLRLRVCVLQTREMPLRHQ